MLKFVAAMFDRHADVIRVNARSQRNGSCYIKIEAAADVVAMTLTFYFLHCIKSILSVVLLLVVVVVVLPAPT